METNDLLKIGTCLLTMIDKYILDLSIFGVTMHLLGNAIIYIHSIMWIRIGNHYLFCE